MSNPTSNLTRRALLAGSAAAALALGGDPAATFSART